MRFDRQDGEALPSETLSNPAFPAVVPGIVFAGYKTPFTWNNFSPRAGVTYALDEDRKTVARASFSRYAGQLNTGTVGVLNPSSTAGSATYRWIDLNADHFAQANEVNLNEFITAAGGFNPANPTAVTSANVLDPDLKAPRTTSIVVGIDREIVPNLAVTANYSYTKTTDLFGNFTGTITPRNGVGRGDYTPGTGFTGTLPDGTPYNVADVDSEPDGDCRRQQRVRDDERARLLHQLQRHRGRRHQAPLEQVDEPRRLLVEQRDGALR